MTNIHFYIILHNFFSKMHNLKFVVVKHYLPYFRKKLSISYWMRSSSPSLSMTLINLHSAYSLHLFLIFSGKSSMNIVKKREPRPDPCGTELVYSAYSDMLSTIPTFFILLFIIFLIIAEF